MPHQPFYASDEERERLIFWLTLINKWFLIPTSVAYIWILSNSPYHNAVYKFTLPTIFYTASSLVFIVFLWFAHRQTVETGLHTKYQRVTWVLNCISYGVDCSFIFFLAFTPIGRNFLWLFFLSPLSLILLTFQWRRWKHFAIDGPASLILLIILYGLLYDMFSSDSPSVSTFHILQADMLLCLSAALFMWIDLRLVRNWVDSLHEDLDQEGKQERLWSEVLQQFPTDMFLVNDQGVLVKSSESARALLHLPEDGSDEWPESVQPIRNALLLRFHAETPIEDTIVVPDDSYPLPIKIYPSYFTNEGKRYCIAIAQEENPDIPAQNAVLRSSRLSIAGQIAAGLAHELGNPLGIIQSCASYLKQKADTDHPHREEFELIEKESKRCQNLIDRLLSLASPKKDTPGVHDLRTILEQSYTLVKYQAGERAIELTMPDHAVNIFVNEGQLSAVFVNLYLNALQSMEHSPPEAQLRIHMRVRGEEAIIDITDEGVGIAKDEIDKVFDPFFTKKAEGTGLGLSIVHQIITSLEGRIDVASKEGAGTTFTIHLPLYKGEVS